MSTVLSKRIWGLGALRREPLARTGLHRRRKHLFAVIFLSLGFVALVLSHVWLRLQVVQMGYMLSTTSKLQSQLEQENRELKVEVATLTSPDRLEAMARRRLGLTPPDKGQVVILP